MEILGSFVLACIHSILFYRKEMGISILLFFIIENGILYYILEKRGRIKNKKGFLLMIPIVLLSSTYFIFSNTLFHIANIVVLIILNMLMLIIITHRRDFLKNYLYRILNLVLGTICDYKDGIEFIKRKTTEYRKDKNAINKNKIKKIITSLLIVLVIVGVVVILLASADRTFANIFKGLLVALKSINIRGIYHIILRFILMMVVMILFLTLILKLQKEYDNKEESTKENNGKFDLTIKLLLITLNIVYLVFCYIQIKSLLTIVTSRGIFNYAGYARTGFFQLMFVSLINFTIILLSNKYSKDKETYIKILKLFLVFFTIVIVICSMQRMYMYEMEYGLTYLRAFVYMILLTELAIWIPTTISIFNTKFDFVKWNMLIILCVYCMINFINIEKIIINKNINKANNKRPIDYDYISKIASEDSYAILEKKRNDNHISASDKIQITQILLDIAENSKKMDWQEFNISRWKIQKSNIDTKKLKEELEKEKQKNKISEDMINSNKSYIYHEKINTNEEYFVEQVDKVVGRALWRIEKVTNNGTKRTEMGKIDVSTPSRIKFFENGLGFLEKPDSIYCAKAELLITRDSGKTFTKIDFPKGEFTLSDPKGEKWEDCYDYFYLPTREKDGTLTVLVSGGYEGGYNGGKTRAKYISKDNAKTWEFVGEILREIVYE